MLNELITTEDMAKILEQAKVSLREQTITGIKEKVINSMQWQIERAVKEQVDTFIQDELAPEIGRVLLEHKPVLLEAAVEASNGMAVILAKAMVDQVVANVATSYKREKMIKAIFD